MNNDDKILKILEDLQADVTTIKATQQAQGKDITTIKTVQQEQGEKIDTLTQKADQIDKKLDREITDMADIVIGSVTEKVQEHEDRIERLEKNQYA